MENQINFIKMINESGMSNEDKRKWEIFLNSDESEKYSLDELQALILSNIEY